MSAKKQLTNEELDSVLQFSNGLYNGFGNYNFFMGTPFTQNQNLLRINNNSSKPTYDRLAQALETSPYDYGKLASYSEFMEIWDALYKEQRPECEYKVVLGGHCCDLHFDGCGLPAGYFCSRW